MSDSDKKAKWSVLVYLAGDNNLTAEMIWGLQELKKASEFLKLNQEPIKGDVNVVAHFDPRGVRSRRYNIVPPWSRLNGKKGNGANGFPDDGSLQRNESAVINARSIDDDLDEARENLGIVTGDNELGAPGRALAAFVASQVEELRAAEKYFVILSGHGSGAEGDFLIDDDPATSLSIPELAHILREARRLYKLKSGESKRIDILGMDSCLMSNVEVCYEIRDSVDYLVASEGFVENTGWPYFRTLQSLKERSDRIEGGDRAAEVVATRMANLYADFYKDYEISGVSTDIAVCNLKGFYTKDDKNDEGKKDENKKAPTLIGSIQNLANALIPELEAWHVHRLLKTSPSRQDLIAALDPLAKEIGGDDKHLLELLLEGAKNLGRDIQETSSYQGGFTRSQAAALEALVDSVDGEFDADRRVKERLDEGLGNVLSGNDDLKPSVALAAVRAKREVDAGARKALQRIETMEKGRGPDAKEERKKAKKDRALLQRFHHLRQLADLKELAPRLKDSLEGKTWLVDALVAARWEAQSFKGSIYVDLYDLCCCLKRRLKELGTKDLDSIVRALRDVMKAVEEGEDRAVVHSRRTGASFQHAHGLSVYFPVNATDYTVKYNNLQFGQKTGWGRLVRAYLQATRRPRRGEYSWLLGEDSKYSVIARYDQLEVDPLDSEGIEARIVGVLEAADQSVLVDKNGRAGTPSSSKAGTPSSSKAGTPSSSKAGTPSSSKAGTAINIRGQVVTAMFGNPPDGFYAKDPLEE